MSSFNKITIVGYLGRDPELRYTPAGEAVCNFSVATTEKRKNRTGQAEEQTTWFRVTVWRNQAEAVHQYLTKGRQVYVEGRLRQEEYTDRDGNPRTSLEVAATDVQFIGARNDQAETPPARTEAPKPAAKQQPAPARGRQPQTTVQLRQAMGAAPVEDEDIPF